MMSPLKALGYVRSVGVAYLVHAGQELAFARLRLFRLTPGDIERLNGEAGAERSNVARDHSVMLDKMTSAIRLAARVVPWRSDCLVQALAAQRWSRTVGIPTSISIQVGYSADREFLAHAVLLHAGNCVLGATEQPLSDIYPPPAS